MRQNMLTHHDWGKVYYIEIDIDYTPVQGRGSWKVRVWEEGFLTFCWQDVSNAWMYEKDGAIEADGKICAWDSFELGDLGHTLICQIRDYHGDKTGAEMVKECFDITQFKVFNWALNKLDPNTYPQRLREKIRDAIALAIRLWRERLLNEYGTEHFEAYAVPKKKIATYAVRERKTGEVYEMAYTLEGAKDIIAYLKDIDLLGNTEEPDKYEIVNTETGKIEK